MSAVPVHRPEGPAALEIDWSKLVHTVLVSRALDDLEDRYQREGFKRLLVNYTSAWPADEPPSTAVAFLDKLTSLHFPRGARIAFLNQPEAHTPASEPVAAGFGYRMRKFRERPDAIAWLLGDGA